MEKHEDNIVKINIEDKYNYLNELYEEFYAIVESVDEGIYVTDEKGNTLRTNQAYKNMSGLTNEDLIGKNVENLVKEGVFSKSGTLEVIKNRNPIRFVQTIKVNNSEKHIMSTCRPVYNNNNEFFRVLTIARDITELKKLQNELEEMKQLTLHYKERLDSVEKDILAKNNIIAKSEKMKSIINKVYKVAKYDTTILITGESGVGKELIANLIYESSGRSKGPFIKINCAAIPDNLIEAELFGYEKGAFTGAINSKKGIFEAANHGCLFLDEIGDLSLDGQGKLLRVLQEKEIRPVGSNKNIKIDTRIIAATNKKLEDLIKKGLFREDLFYRLNILSIHIPPLRERKDDIWELVNYYINFYNKKYNLNKKVSLEVIHILENYTWPGNIRELRCLIEQLMIICDSNIIEKDNLSMKLLKNTYLIPDILDSNNSNLKDIVSNFELKIITDTIEQCGSIRKAAKKLGVHYSTLAKKLKTVE